MKISRYFALAMFCVSGLSVNAQPVAIPPINYRSVPLNQSASRIYSAGLDPFLAKLVQLQKEKSGVVRIVQIGDSHIQAGSFADIVRDGLQNTFGDAGRGLVFPYQVAKSNAPDDIKSNSNTSWRSNRLAHPEIPLACGVSGFCIQANRPGANMQLTLQPNGNGTYQSFKHLKIFTDSNSSWLLKTDSNNIILLKHQPEDANQLWFDVLLGSPVTGFVIETQTSETASFYGALLETDMTGVIYNSIGVNGARYDHYNQSPLFWKQLPALNADLYIISLGTNEAQASAFDAVKFEKNVSDFIKNIHRVSPKASILITTPIDSYRAGRPNRVLQQLSDFLSKYCMQKDIPLWDMYRVTLGYGGSRNWIKRGLMAKDRVHFIHDGYELQGALLLDALLKRFNQYVEAR